jgi:hypothetical protein
MLHGTCRHILFEKNSDQKNWWKFLSAEISWSLPTKERLAQHTPWKIIAWLMTRATSFGQDRTGLTRLSCFVGGSAEKYSPLARI